MENVITTITSDRRFFPRRGRHERRMNWLGRVVVELHRRYYVPRLKPVIWTVLIVTSIVEVILVASAK